MTEKVGKHFSEFIVFLILTTIGVALAYRAAASGGIRGDPPQARSTATSDTIKDTNDTYLRHPVDQPPGALHAVELHTIALPPELFPRYEGRLAPSEASSMGVELRFTEDPSSSYLREQ